ncbi:MAG TPA: lytic polysaccharide monooxygenase, partial [Gammaproteobacteria bacterium]
MVLKTCKYLTVGLLLAGVSLSAYSHGLIESPKSRNWLCGAEIKPDQASGTACAPAFANDFNGGYQFMSVLTHAQGRKVVKNTTNVCGFDSETWGGGATPWDTAMNWPTQSMSAGSRTFTWNISWGPHFDDTAEFVYYITTSGFQFDPNRRLTWSDFESQPFCNLSYTHGGNNPGVVADVGAAKFHTTCNVPSRSGHHVIYAEWGRNQWTYERFHGCVDVQFGGGSGSSSSSSSSSSS